MTKTAEQLYKELGPQWQQILGLNSTSLKKIDILYSKYKLVPDKEYLFKSFCIEPTQVEAIVLGQDPYPFNEGIGYAFAIKEEVKKPKSFLRLESYFKQFDINLDRTLNVWKKARIISVNVSLFTKYGKPGEFISFFENFTKQWIKNLEELNPFIYFIIFGREAERIFKESGTGFHHEFHYHPAYRGEWKPDLKYMIDLINNNLPF